MSNLSTATTMSRRNLLFGGALLAAAGTAIATTGCSGAGPEGGSTQDAAAAGSGKVGKVNNGVKVKGGFQLEQSFPVLADADAFDDSLITNATATFLGFTGQGTVFVKAKDPSAFKLFVNGVELPLDQVKGDDWASIDISGITVNGDNRLQASCLDESAGALEVRIGYPELIDETDANKDNDNFKLLDEIIQAEIDNGFTSAQLVVTHNGRILKQAAYGLCNSYAPDGKRLSGGAKVTNDTLYDLASNTKMYTANFAIQKLVADGKIDVTELVSTYIPEFHDRPGDAIPGKDALTVQEILEHQAGFPADPQYHNPDYSPAEQKTIPGSRANAALFTQNRDEVLQKIIETPLEYTPGTETKYSDVDYMLLGFIVERVSGQRLDEFMRDAYYAPLGLEHVTFNPLDNGFAKDDCAATELNGNTRDNIISFDNIRTDTVQGEVHDEKAFYAMGGISGHAGLFSNARDLAVLTQVIINRGGYGNLRFFDGDTADQFIKPKDSNPSYGLGWRRKAQSAYAWAFSPLSDPATVGHTGWTGTLTVVDPVQHISVVLLTNAKNSPVLDNIANPNDFVGNHFLTSGYGLPATIAFDAEGANADCNAAKIVDLVRAKANLIATNEEYQTEPDRGELRALMQVAKARKDNAIVSAFMESKAWKAAKKLSK